MKVLNYKSESVKVRELKKLIKSAGNQIFSVWFIKRSDGKRRKIAARLHVTKPTYCKAPNSNSGNVSYRRKQQDDNKGLMTIFDVNMIRRNNKNRMCGRGGYKSIPVEGIFRVKVQGEIYKVM